jgi:hypothetical protein
MTSPSRTRRAPAVGRELRTAARSRFGRNVATTAVANLVSTGTAGVTGIVIARTLGPAGRGEYAAIVTWFGPPTSWPGNLGAHPPTSPPREP